MDLFSGLTAQQLGIIRHTRIYREVFPGDIIFKEGEPAASLYSIIKGKIQIYRDTVLGEVELAQMGAGEVFGEMGLLVNSGRTAAARVIEPALLFEIPNNIIEVMRQTCPPESVLKLLENLVCILSERLRRQGDLNEHLPDSTAWKDEGLIAEESSTAIKLLERSAPSGLISRFTLRKKLQPGEILCSEGEESDGFYFLRRGEMEILKKQADGSERSVAIITAPTVTGELGFFSGQKRAATIRAVTECTVTHFSGSQFNKLKKSDPNQACDVLMAAAQLAIHLMVNHQ
ncbi:cyclic nucleotide-binding domain-containing protein [Candidatus Sumerlaeota bacterium]|nr:cyclic nucleotide-binding domain-containing protein [Candidatus Sumerlaeota bacterium]